MSLYGLHYQTRVADFLRVHRKTLNRSHELLLSIVLQIASSHVAVRLHTPTVRQTMRIVRQVDTCLYWSNIYTCGMLWA